MVATTVKVGDEFGVMIADGIERFRVTDMTARTVFAVGLSELVDVDGKQIDIATQTERTREFAKSEVVGYLRSEKANRRSISEQEQFWNDQEVGAVLHYDHGFGKFVRGHVAVVHGKNQFVPDALVGNWEPYELPHHTATGEVDHGYFADKIAAGETSAWRPHFSTIVEHSATLNTASYSFGVDPLNSPAIDLTVPEQNDDERREADKEKALRDIARIAGDRSVSTGERLAAITVRLAEHLREA